MSDNKCPKCGQEYIITSIDFRKICRCENPERYDLLKKIFKDVFEEDENIARHNME